MIGESYAEGTRPNIIVQAVISKEAGRVCTVKISQVKIYNIIHLKFSISVHEGLRNDFLRLYGENRV